MQAFRPLFLAALSFLALALSACLNSKQPLFDQAKAVTPVPPARYEELENQYGNWAKKLAGTLTLQGQTYGWQPDDEEGQTRFTLYDIGGGFYVAAARPDNPGPEDPYTYALIEASQDGYSVYLPGCAEVVRMRQPKEDLPAVEDDHCFYADRETLVRALRRYAAVMLPAKRYVPIRPAENK
jgi:hypothetical protein